MSIGARKAILVGGISLVALVAIYALTLQSGGPPEEVETTVIMSKAASYGESLRSTDRGEREIAMSQLHADFVQPRQTGDLTLSGPESESIGNEVIPELMRLASGDDEEERVTALATLAGFRVDPPGDKDTLEVFMVAVLSDYKRDIRERIYATDSLSGLIPFSSETVDSLLLALSSEPDRYVKSEIANLLAQSTGEYPDLENELFAASREGDAGEREAVVRALQRLPEVSEAARSAVRERLGDSDARVRNGASRTMSRISYYRYASEADAEALLGMIRNPDEVIKNRIDAMFAYTRIIGRGWPTQNLQPLKDLIKDDEVPSEVRAEALQSLPFASRSSRDLVPYLTRWTQSSDPLIANGAHSAIRAIESMNFTPEEMAEMRRR